jgi:hypothetical protein
MRLAEKLDWKGLMLPQGKKRIMAMEAFKQYTHIILDLAISSVTTFIFARKG